MRYKFHRAGGNCHGVQNSWQNLSEFNCVKKEVKTDFVSKANISTLNIFVLIPVTFILE